MVRQSVRASIALVFVVMLAGAAWAVDVDREELESQITGTVEFQNYEGPHETIDTVEAIRGIGRDLGAVSLEPGEVAEHFNLYRVVHAVDPDTEEGLDADIFIIMENAEVDHIDNVRRIVSGYLTEAYGYMQSDADTLAEFVTIYNALYRGQYEFFQGRYKEVVLSNLTPEAAGISTLYSDWPGNTEMVIPLSVGAAPGQIGALDAMQLADELVIERLRMREDMGIAERKSMVEIMERIIEEEREEIARERRAIDEEEADIAEERQQVEEDLEEVREQREEAEEQEDTAAEEELDQREEELEEEQEQLAEREEEVEERRQEVEEQEERVEEMTEEVREQREQIAADQREQLEEEQAEPAEEAEPVTFLRVRRQGGERLRQFVKVDPATGDVVSASELDTISSSESVLVGNDRLVIAMREDRAVLSLVDGESLDVLRFGSETLFRESLLRTADAGQTIYAVVQEDGRWYLGRFNANLELTERSSVAVDPYTSLTFTSDSIYVQTSDGDIARLSREDMTSGN